MEIIKTCANCTENKKEGCTILKKMINVDIKSNRFLSLLFFISTKKMQPRDTFCCNNHNLVSNTNSTIKVNYQINYKGEI